MSLVHWWPLKGDYIDYVTGVAGTNQNTTTIAGKLSPGAIHCNGTSWIETNQSVILGTNNFTLAAWVKIEEDLSRTFQAVLSNKGAAAAAEGFSIYWNHTQKKFLWSTADGAAGEYWMVDTIDDFIYNGWHHIAMVRDNHDAKVGYFYIDGVRYEISGTAAIRNITAAATVKIGKNNTTSQTYYHSGGIQDVRIYDHALSPAEAKELARGLILHYTFEEEIGQPNRIINPNNFTAGQVYGYDASGASKLGSYSVQTDGSLKIVDEVANTRLQLKTLIDIEYGKQYTVSIKYKNLTDINDTFQFQLQEFQADGSTRVTTHFSRANGQKEFDLDDGWKLIYYHYTPRGTNAKKLLLWLQDGADYTNYTHSYCIKDLKFENGYTDTPVFGYEGFSKTYDSSGNGKHGIIHGPVQSLDSNVGARSLYFTTGYERVEIQNLVLPTDKVTVSIWFKSAYKSPINGYHIPFALNTGAYEISIPANGTELRFGANVNGSRRVGNAKAKTYSGAETNLLDGNWHLLTTVWDGTCLKGYTNGQYVGMQNYSGSLTSNTGSGLIGRFYNDSTSNYGITQGYVSELRIYSTALSEADIQSLYRHTVKINSDQCVIANHLEERGESKVSDYLNPAAYKHAGWGGTIVPSGDITTLTATNGWHAFCLYTPSYWLGKNGVLSFEYCFLDKTNIDPGSGCWVHTTSKDAQYLIGSGPAIPLTDLGIWSSISLPLNNLRDYYGWTLRGVDKTGLQVIMQIRNVRLTVDKVSVQIQPSSTASCNNLNEIAKVRVESHGLLTASDFVEL
jgi:hypothetical protein